MNKGFLDDTFEKALEAGQSMAKSGAKQIKQTFNPVQMLKNAADTEVLSPEQQAQKMQEKAKKEGKNNTPLDFNKLEKSYGEQDEAKAKIMAERLFKLVKSGEEKAIRDEEQKDAEKKQQEANAEHQKKQQEAQAKQQQTQEMPQGKERRSILAGKKKKSGTPATAEVKPSQSKQ